MKRSIILVNLESPGCKVFFLPMGLMILANCLEKHGYDTEIFHERAILENISRLLKKARDALYVGFYTKTGSKVALALKVSKCLKEMGICVVWGGPHATLLPEVTLSNPWVDYIIMGDGEESLVGLTRALSEKKSVVALEGVGYKDSGNIFLKERSAAIRDLDRYPALWHKVDVERYLEEMYGVKRILPVLTSRGCPYRCAFCYNNNISNRIWRARSEDSMVKELEILKNEYRLGGFYFFDDNFFTDKKRAFSIIERLNVPWFAEARADIIDEDFVRFAKKTKCLKIYLGAESGSQRVLNLIKKDITVSQVEKAVSICNESRVNVELSFIMMVPEETNKDRDETLSFIVDLDKKYTVDIDGPKIYTPYPGTELFEISKQNGWVPPNSLEEWSKLDRFMNPLLLQYVKRKDVNKYNVLRAACAIILEISRYLRKQSLKKDIISYMYRLIRDIEIWRIRKKISAFPIEIKLYIRFLSGRICRVIS